MKVYSIRCTAGGYVIGVRMENVFGEPLTRREAHKLAKYENERSARRREQKLGGCFDYYVHEFEKPAELVLGSL